MNLRFLTFILILFSSGFCRAQALKLNCLERKKKSPEVNDSIIIQTCFIRNFKFVTTSYPDYAGRYTFSEHEVYARTGGKYVKTTNSNVFNKEQNKLVAIINRKIGEDFKEFSSDTNTRDCFTGIDSIPVYRMNDLDISFNGNDIWFQVHWGLGSACRNVDGTIISFSLDEIKKYLK